MKPFIACFLFLLLISCSGNKSDDIYTVTLSRKDFVDMLLLDGVVDPVKSHTASCPMFVQGVVVYLVEDGTIVSRGDTVAIIEAADLVIQHDRVTTDLENTRMHFEKVKADLIMQSAMLEAQVQTNEADKKIVSRDSLELLYASPRERRAKELELERLALERAKIDRKFQTLKVVNQTEIKRWEVEIERKEREIESMERRLSELILTAPADGLAVRAHSFFTGQKIQVGDPVYSNMPLILIPQTDEMKVSLSISERDFKYVSVGDSVYYTFDAMPDNFAFGKITNKTPVGKEYKQGSKVKFFDIEASIDSMERMPPPGFTANCHVVVRHLADTVVVPQISIFDEDSIKVVYVLDRNRFEKRQVLTGIHSVRESVVTAGLEGDETVAMELPSPRRIKRTVLLPDSVLSEGVDTDIENEETADEIPELQNYNHFQ